MTRAFGDDVALMLALAAPAVAVYVVVRWLLLRRSRSHPLLAAVVEAAAAAYAACVGAVTLIPSGLGDPRQVDWRLFSSDLGYAPERTQVAGNLLLFAPLVAFLMIAISPRRPLL